MLGTLSQTAPLVGNLALFPAADAPYYRRGMWTSAGVSLGGLLIALTTITFLTLANRKRDKAAAQREAQSLRSEGNKLSPSVSAGGQAAGTGIDEEKASLAVGASGEAQRERLAAKRHLDMSVPEEKEEALRRYIDEGRRGEDSPYFRYVV